MPQHTGGPRPVCSVNLIVCNQCTQPHSEPGWRMPAPSMPEQVCPQGWQQDHMQAMQSAAPGLYSQETPLVLLLLPKPTIMWFLQAWLPDPMAQPVPASNSTT